MKKLLMLSLLLSFLGNTYAADDKHEEQKDADHKEAGDHKEEHKDEHKEEHKDAQH